MGCGFKIDNRDLIVQLLTNDFSEISQSKENDLCSWSLECNVNNISTLSSRLVNPKNNSKANAITCRTNFGYKSNNKVNNYNFRHYKSNENYMIQYRTENKSQRCLPYNVDIYDAYSTSSEMPSTGIVPQKLCSEPQEKPLIHQVRFWQSQNPLIQPMGDINPVGDSCKLHLGSTVSKTNNTNAFAQRSTFNTKRNLDMIVPQGTTYDILSDDNRLCNRDEADKLNLKIGDEVPGLVSVPYSYLRESTKVRRFAKEGGSLEFARLLDEKLRQLYEQRILCQPIIEINRVKPDTKNIKHVSRLKSANQIKERSHQIVHSNSLNGLSVNGQSAGSKFINASQKISTAHESQCICCTPCLLPQMPAFGTHNFPRFITFHKFTNSSGCQMSQHDEE